MDNFSTAREMEGYREQPKAMPVGTPGKQGLLDLEFEIDSRGKSILRKLDRRAPLIVQQALYFDEEMPGMPCVYILSSGGPNVDGDRFFQRIVMHKGSYAFVTTGAATKLAEMKFNFSGMRQVIELEENSYLEFMPEPVIPCHHTRYISDTDLVIDPTATLFYSEIYTCGRKYYKQGERFAYDILSVCAHGERPKGESLFREKFIIRPTLYSPMRAGVMDDFDVFGNVIVMTPQDHAEKIFASTPSFIDRGAGLAAGITRLPSQCGLLFKVLGCEAEPVKKCVREFCSRVREEVKGKKLPQEFPWR